MTIIPSLQQLALRWVSTEDIVRSNLTHLLGFENRLVQDFCHYPIEPMDSYFLSAFLDPSNTSFFWMMQFVNKKIHRLHLNAAMLACWQEYYRPNQTSLLVFAMRIDFKTVAMFVYTMNYREKVHMTENIFNQKCSDRWTGEDWQFLLTFLQFKRLFTISSQYINKRNSR